MRNLRIKDFGFIPCGWLGEPIGEITKPESKPWLNKQVFEAGREGCYDHEPVCFVRMAIDLRATP
jgi:hypothetical protein